MREAGAHDHHEELAGFSRQSIRYHTRRCACVCVMERVFSCTSTSLIVFDRTQYLRELAVENMSSMTLQILVYDVVQHLHICHCS